MSEILKAVPKPAWVDEFKAFIMRGNVVDLAVGVVIGAAFTGIVGSLVKDMITPFIGLLTGGVDFSNLFITLKGPVEPTLADAVKAGSVTLNYGVFLNAVLNFLIVAFAIFWMVRLVSKLHKSPPHPHRGDLGGNPRLAEIPHGGCATTGDYGGPGKLRDCFRSRSGESYNGDFRAPARACLMHVSTGAQKIAARRPPE
jgi:large conductance mechanosensitive channel